MKIRLLTSRVVVANNRTVLQQNGDIVTVTKAEGERLIASGHGVAVTATTTTKRGRTVKREDG